MFPLHWSHKKAKSVGKKVLLNVPLGEPKRTSKYLLHFELWMVQVASPKKGIARCLRFVSPDS